MTLRLQPPSVLLSGPSGSGKTSALVTQTLHGIRTFVLVTEPDGVASLLDAADRLKAPIDLLHWAVCTPGAAGWMELADMISKISSMDQKQLADQRDMGKSAFRPPAMHFLNMLKNFHCERTDQDWGDFTTWDDSCSLNIDSLTGWCMIAFGCTVGFKPTANPGEWGIAQNFVQSMLVKINSDRDCFFNLTAHVEKEMDELTGVRKLMVSAIGAKLAPKIPPFFSEVVLARRTLIQGNRADFRWSTVDGSMDLKNRALPIGSDLPADFGPIVAAYRRRVALAKTGSAAPGGAPAGPPGQSAPGMARHGVAQPTGAPNPTGGGNVPPGAQTPTSGPPTQPVTGYASSGTTPTQPSTQPSQSSGTVPPVASGPRLPAAPLSPSKAPLQ